MGKKRVKKFLSTNFSAFQDKNAGWFGLGQWPLVQDNKRVGTPPVIQIVHHHPPPPPPPPKMTVKQQLQSMAAVMAELTQRNQELTKEVNRQCQNHGGE